MDLRRVTHHSVAACCMVTVAGMALTACNESSQSIASAHATAVDITTPSGVQIVLIPAGEFSTQVSDDRSGEVVKSQRFLKLVVS